MSIFSKIFGKSMMQDYKALLDRGAVIIDVRSPHEYDNGHIRGSKNIPLNIIAQRAEQIKSWDKPVITVCKSGARSRSAQSMLKKVGVEVYNGGGWSSLQEKIS